MHWKRLRRLFTFCPENTMLLGGYELKDVIVNHHKAPEIKCSYD